MIEVAGVTLRRGGRVLLDDFSWELPDPGVYLLLGGTGSGKSLLCNLLAGRARPQSGSVRIDGEAVYRGWAAHPEPAFLARAEEECPDDEPLEKYLSTELQNAGGSPSALADVWPVLDEVLPDGRRTTLAQLSHGQVLLAQVALAALVPSRVVLLDGHLTYLDHRHCAMVPRLLAACYKQPDRFLILTAARLAAEFPAAHESFLLAGQMPLQITSLDHSATLDTALNIVGGNASLRVYAESGYVGANNVSSGRNFEIVSRLENGLRVHLTGRLDDALEEMRSQGMRISRLEWEGKDITGGTPVV
ncbi:ATP-binding cassette domain-containing protein [bacterium]|nr:ATP-binding cassette domain-containing protein [bacterium]